MMFGNSKYKVLRTRIDKLNDRYWDLWARHDRLLRHLGLEEVHQEPRTFIRTRDDAEQKQKPTLMEELNGQG